MSPQEAGMSSEILERLISSIPENYDQINSIIVLRKGNIVLEEYFHGSNPNTIFLTASVTKTITSLLIGSAIQNGYINSVDDVCSKYLSLTDYSINDTRINSVTLESLLTMTSGLFWRNNIDLGNPAVAEDPVAYFVGLPVVSNPGTVYNYSTFDSQILSIVLTEATGQIAERYAEQHLFGPLGITRWNWETDNQGHSLGGMGLSLRSRDMAKIGQLIVDDGIWNGVQIIPEEWITRSRVPYSSGGSPEHTDYGYHIWVTDETGYDAVFAGGYGGQYIYIIPVLEIVVVITSELDTHHIENRELVVNFIVPAVDG